jgi:protein O-mannosyl-transferase
MGLFFLLTLLTWVEFLDQQTRRRWRLYLLALVLYALALLSKTTACTLPAALLLILWLRKKSVTKETLLQVVPFVVLGIAMGLLTIWWERYHQGTRGPLFALGLIERILIASRAVWFYLGKLFWPSNLTFIYPRWIVSPTDPRQYAWLAALGGLSAAIFFARRYVGRSLEVAALFFVATLSPVLGFIMLYTFRYTFVADHYQYLASIGPIALASAGITTLAASFKESRHLIFGAAVCLLAALTMLTWRQSTMYADIEALWRTTIARNPGSWMAHNNLGIVLSQKGETEEAIAHYRKTLEMSPDFADADYNLGNALLQKGEVDAAIVHCQRAVTIQPNDPEAQVALGNALFQKGLIDESIVHYEKALAIRPYYVTAHYNLGSAFLRKGEIDEAIFHCRAVLSIQPEHADAHTILANAFLQKGEIGTAIEQYKKTLEIAPRSVAALNNLAWILATYSDPAFRDGTKALELAQRANEFSGRNNPIILRTLAAAHANVGQFSTAVEVGQLALSLTDRQSPLVGALQRELAGYEASEPYREGVKR